MGLFKPGTGSASGSFVGKDEKAVLIFNKVAFPILKVVKQDSQYGPQYLIETVLPGSEEGRIVPFKADAVPNRAAGLETIIEMQEAGTYTPITVIMVRDDKAIVLVEAEDAETAAVTEAE